MRTIPMIVFMAATAASPEPRFFAKEVDFWGRAPRKQAVALWEGESAPPPGPARDLLERPTAENAKRYLEWQEERLERLQKALEALEAASSEGAASTSILLFARDDCPYSRAQEESLRGLPVTIVRLGNSTELWTRHAVTATPTVVVNGRTFRGFTDRSVIERAWRAGVRP